MTKVTGFTPTAEQLEAQKARRAAQAAEKAAKKSTGHKTVFDKKQGKYISLDVEKVKAAKAQREAQKAAEEAAKKAGRFGGKTIADPANPGKYISQSAAETAAKAGKAVKPVKPTGKTSGGLLSKIGKFFKGKGGKIALIGAGIAALVGGGIYLYNKLTGKKDTPAQEESVTPTPTPEETPETPDTPSTPVAPTPTPEETPETPVAPPEEQEEAPDNSVPKDYTVKEGDCVWNIAKQHLKDMNPDPSYKPTNAEILKHTKELMELNQLEFEPDGYHVMIKPKDTLKLTA